MKKVYINNELIRDIYKLEIETLWENSAFLLGESIFTTFLLKDGEYLFLDDHFNRLEKSIFWQWQNNLDIKLIIEIKRILKSEKNNIGSFKCRLSFFILESNINYSLSIEKITLSNILNNSLLKLISKDHPSFCFNRPSTVKVGSYSEIVRLKNIAKIDGIDDILLVSPNGSILETTFGNIFFLKSNKIFTPIAENGMLAGITRLHLINCFKNNDIEMIQKTISLDELDDFDGAFLSSSIKGLVQVFQINKSIYKNNFEFIKKIDQIWNTYTSNC